MCKLQPIQGSYFNSTSDDLSTGGIDKNPCATYNNIDIYLSY